MDSTIYYTRHGQPRTAFITTRLVPNMLAVKFAVIAQEIEEGETIPAMEGHSFLDELLTRMGVAIVDVVPMRKTQRKKD